MNSNSINSQNLGLHTVVPSFVQNSSIRPTSTIVSNSSSPINLFTNLSTGSLSSSSSANNQGQTTSSRLKVEDALSYLDRVKNQFALQPQVYNRFLDIMKEFKSQSIDTQEVINRVSTLFHGHPDLIVGFNTFLPPGYKIEVSDDHYGYIQVTHPSSRTESIAIGNLQSNGTLNFAIGTGGGGGGVRQISNILTSEHDETSNNFTAQAVNALISAANAPQQSYFGTTGGLNLNTKPSKQSTSQSNPPTPTTSNGQPVEFNHAINYVNKIKNRFHQNPNVYKTFLEILYAYQKQQRNGKDSSSPTANEENSPSTVLSEKEVYAKVAQLFTNHEDLLAEFSQFLPDASQQNTDRSNLISDILSSSVSTPSSVPSSSSSIVKDEPMTLSSVTSKRSMISSKSTSMTKKKRMSTVELDPSDTAGQNHALPSLDELTFFDKVQKTLRSPSVFDNFLRCILLYTKQIVSRIELFALVQNYLSHAPELLKTFQELINLREPGEVIIPKSIYDQNDTDSMISIDYGSCTQYGKSYRSVPRSYIPPMCTGRTQLCKDVLNDDCVLFPTFTDESSSVAAKKSVFEEHMFKIEDERFELDIVMEVNLSAIQALESVQTQMNSLTNEQLNNFQLDDQLGGQSAFTQRQAVQRIYGERANEIIDGLKRNPRVAVPIVLKRLKSKDEEWRESKKNFERFWKEQSEKYYLKSLDYMGINCKNSDARIIRNRHLLNEIENIKEEREQQLTVNDHQPHLILAYDDISVLDDVASLILFLIKRQMTYAKDDKQNMKKFINQFLPNFLFTTRGELSDDDNEDNDVDDNENNSKREKKPRLTRQTDNNRRKNLETSPTKPRPAAQQNRNSDDLFHLFFVNDNFYYFFRLHQLLCERLTKMFQQSNRLIEEENHESQSQRSRSTTGVRFSNRMNIPVEEYYSIFLDLVRQFLDGTVDSSTYEDSLREMFGIHAYIAFTMDKILYNCVRQLHAIITDQSSEALMELYFRSKGSTGLVDDLYSTKQENLEATYQHQIEAHADGNRLFRLCSFQNEHRLTISLISIESSEDEEQEENDETEKEKIVQSRTDYVDSYLHDNDNRINEAMRMSVKTRSKERARFLLRNLSAANQRQTSSPDLVTINHDYCNIDAKTLKRIPIQRAGFFFYRPNSFRSTRQHHQSVTKRQHERFVQFHRQWEEKALVNHENTDPINNLWTKTHRFHPNDSQRLIIQPSISDQSNDLSRAPYRHYRQYRLIETEK